MTGLFTRPSASGTSAGYGVLMRLALPEFYKTDLELHDVILHVADDLHFGMASSFHKNN